MFSHVEIIIWPSFGSDFLKMLLYHKGGEHKSIKGVLCNSWGRKVHAETEFCRSRVAGRHKSPEETKISSHDIGKQVMGLSSNLIMKKMRSWPALLFMWLPAKSWSCKPPFSHSVFFTLFLEITKIIPGPWHLSYKPVVTNVPTCQVDELVIVV